MHLVVIVIWSYKTICFNSFFFHSVQWSYSNLLTYVLYISNWVWILKKIYPWFTFFLFFQYSYDCAPITLAPMHVFASKILRSCWREYNTSNSNIGQENYKEKDAEEKVRYDWGLRLRIESNSNKLILS